MLIYSIAETGDNPNLVFERLISIMGMNGATSLIEKLKEIVQQENCGRIEFFIIPGKTPAFEITLETKYLL